jgi:hypothetical protein
MPKYEIFYANDSVPAHGIYRVIHAAHKLPEAVALFKSEKFPGCSRCSSPVSFRLMHEFAGLDLVPSLQIRVPLSALLPLGE